MREYSSDVVVIGGGPAGLAAASSCLEAGAGRVLLVEKEAELGGILPQCIHTGFGLLELKEDLTGPEFAEVLEERALNLGAQFLMNSYASRLWLDEGGVVVECVSPRGIEVVHGKCLIYAAGCRERIPSEVGIVGDRPSGVFTAGTAQTLMDLYGLLPGERVVVVGSGDVGLIMSRRFAVEGAKVVAVVEMMKHPGGLTRNVVQCLEDYGIPLLLSHTVLEVRGKSRVKSVMVCELDENLTPIGGTEREIECDTVIVATGLLPEVGLLEKAGAEVDRSTGGPIVNEFLETSLRGVFACGNVLVVNDLVDYAVEQGRLCARSAKSLLDGTLQRPEAWRRSAAGEGVRFVVPQLFSGAEDVTFYARVKKPKRNCRLSLREVPMDIKLPIVRPAEMLRISVKRDYLSKVERLTLEVVE